jgi:ribosomal protein S18 acetylase RimI-like enzyme
MADTLPHFSIRRATPADAERLGALSTKLFVDTFVHGFGIAYPQADIDFFIDESHSPHAYAAILADPEKATWIAEGSDGAPAGYLVCGRHCHLPVAGVQPEDGQLRRLYVTPATQGAGLADRLMAIALDWLEAARRPIWLGVWSGNGRAQRFYVRHGFKKIAEFDDPIGQTIDLEFAMRRPAGAF